MMPVSSLSASSSLPELIWVTARLMAADESCDATGLAGCDGVDGLATCVDGCATDAVPFAIPLLLVICINRRHPSACLCVQICLTLLYLSCLLMCNLATPISLPVVRAWLTLQTFPNALSGDAMSAEYDNTHQPACGLTYA